MVIPLALDAAEAGGSLCLGADVLQGDTPMLERRVTVSLESGNSPGNSSIRVRTTVPVDEPVVTITVRAGCDMKSTRSYVLLADVPSDVTPGVAIAGAGPSSEAVSTQRRAARPASRTVGGGSGGAASPDGSATPTARRAAARSSAERENTAQAAPQASAPVAPPPRRAAPIVPRAVPAARPTPAAPTRTDSVATGPRLQVEALEPEPARDSGLKTTAQLKPPPVEDPARRAAAAALWGVMNPAAEQAQRETQRNKELEASLAALREQTAQNQRALLELRSELAQARESQFRNPLVYALVAGLLLALIALLLLWRANRRAAASAWWRESVLQPEGEDKSRRLRRHRGLLDEGESESDPDSEDEPPKKRTLGMTTFGATPFAPLAPDDGDETGAPPPAARPLEGAAARPVNTEELFDVQQQSDFFLSLGQHDQAIDVLREHIAANPGTSALAYLDLLRIYHSLDRREDYAHLAEEFERAFNADVPPFDKYTDAGKGLEHYRSALARIESQWPAPSTLALIEELIFRKPGVHEDGAFDLTAYQELLLLYALAKEVIEPEPDAVPPAAVAPAPFTDTHAATATAPLWPDTVPPDMHDGPTLPPSIYGSIDDRLHHDTVMAPDAPVVPIPGEEREAPPRAVPPPELDLAEFDKTAYETMPTPIEPSRPPTPSSDPHIIDFDLFDPATEAEIAPKTKSIKR